MDQPTKENQPTVNFLGCPILGRDNYFVSPSSTGNPFLCQNENSLLLYAAIFLFLFINSKFLGKQCCGYSSIKSAGDQLIISQLLLPSFHQQLPETAEK